MTDGPFSVRRSRAVPSMFEVVQDTAGVLTVIQVYAIRRVAEEDAAERNAALVAANKVVSLVPNNQRTLKELLEEAGKFDPDTVTVIVGVDLEGAMCVLSTTNDTGKMLARLMVAGHVVAEAIDGVLEEGDG